MRACDLNLGVQNWKGNAPGGYVSDEHQDMLVIAIWHFRRKIREVVERVPQDIRDWHVRFEKSIGWRRDVMGHPYFAVAEDGAQAHSMTYWPDALAGNKRVDRLELPKGHPGYFPLETCQFMPTSKRVQDSVQCGIEMVIKPAKGAGRKLLHERHQFEPMTSQLIWECLKKGVEEKVTPELCHACLRHATEACRVFSAKHSETVCVQVHGKELKVKGTDGDWVPSPVNG